MLGLCIQLRVTPYWPTVIRGTTVVSAVRGSDPMCSIVCGRYEVSRQDVERTMRRLRFREAKMGRLYCEKLPNCSLVLVYDAGHALDADRPEAFVSVANDFLQHQEGFLVNRQSRLIHP